MTPQIIPLGRLAFQHLEGYMTPVFGLCARSKLIHEKPYLIRQSFTSLAKGFGICMVIDIMTDS
jgi:hypothetical protein